MTPTVNHVTRLCAQLISQASIHVVDTVQDAVEAAHGLWSEHQRLMDTHGVYCAVVTSGAGYLGRRLDLEGVALTVVSALIRQRTRPTRPRFSDDWDSHPDDWPI